MNAAVIFNIRKDNDFESITLITKTLLKLGARVFMFERCAGNFPGLKVTYCDTAESLIKSSDVLLAIGGDGTIMHAAKLASEFNKPVLGINNGRLGFMASIEKNQIDSLSKLIDGNYKISRRIMLEADYKGQKFFALNDIVVSRAPETQIIDYRIYRASENICGYRADGVIVSTPTGSTAYSLSAGGPIVEADMDCIIVTPVCAHSLYARSMVLGSGEPITVDYNNNNNSKISVSIDGRVCFSDPGDNNLKIKKADTFAKFIILGQNDFYKNIDKKLINKNSL